ncbi:MAG: hypothetical protein NVSMB31_17590 [Vulcanimicrobiaceae bacterium]
MDSAIKPDWNRILIHGAVAGLIGGILIDAFLYVATLMPQGQPITALWQFVASTAIGKGAFADPNSAWLGLFMHLCTSVGWGVAFAYVASTRPNVPAHPYASGLIYGVIVMIIMQIVLMVAKSWQPPTLQATLISLIAHCVFFGLPVSLYVARTLRS